MKILILAYYNPWISGGGHRPICLCEEDIARYFMKKLLMFIN